MKISALAQASTILSWQQSIWKKLTARFPHIAHGLLFYGKRGCGKQLFAVQFAKWLLCAHKQPEASCGQCPSCAWFNAGTHPQLKLIHAEFDEKKQSYTAIKVDQIREINHFIEQKVDGWRVIVIQPAEKMNIAAANALLKTLEEPGERVLLMLLCESPLQLPATIRSRLQHHALDRLNSLDAMQYLQQHGMQDEMQTQISLSLAENMPLYAFELVHRTWFIQRKAFFNSLLILVKTKNQPIKFSTYWLGLLDIHDILILLRYIIVDSVSHKLQQPVKQIDIDIPDFASAYGLDQIFEVYRSLNLAQTMLKQNIQSQLILDQLAMQLMNIKLTKDEV